MREAGQKIANTFRTFADKEEVDYSKQEQKFSKTELAKKPWEWQKKVYESMVLHLDASIDKVEDLAMDAEIERMKENDVEKVAVPAEEMMKGMAPVSVVAEPSEYQYGAEAFEAAFPKMEQGKNMDAKAPEMKAPVVSNNGKHR